MAKQRLPGRLVIYTNPVRTSQETHPVSTTKTTLRICTSECYQSSQNRHYVLKQMTSHLVVTYYITFMQRVDTQQLVAMVTLPDTYIYIYI
jgi:hypothetical protein